MSVWCELEIPYLHSKTREYQIRPKLLNDSSRDYHRIRSVHKHRHDDFRKTWIPNIITKNLLYWHPINDPSCPLFHRDVWAWGRPSRFSSWFGGTCFWMKGYVKQYEVKIYRFYCKFWGKAKQISGLKAFICTGVIISRKPGSPISSQTLL